MAYLKLRFFFISLLLLSSKFLKFLNVLFHVDVQTLEKEISSGKTHCIMLSHFQKISCFSFEVLLVLLLNFFNVIVE